MRQAIVTKYLGPTNHRGSRIKATATAGTVTVPWDSAQGVDENHERAARALAQRFNWLDRNTLAGGCLPGSVYAHCCFVLIAKAGAA